MVSQAWTVSIIQTALLRYWRIRARTVKSSGRWATQSVMSTTFPKYSKVGKTRNCLKAFAIPWVTNKVGACSKQSKESAWPVRPGFLLLQELKNLGKTMHYEAKVTEWRGGIWNLGHQQAAQVIYFLRTHSLATSARHLTNDLWKSCSLLHLGTSEFRTRADLDNLTGEAAIASCPSVTSACFE